MAAAVRDVLLEDRNRNGVPDAFEARPPVHFARPPAQFHGSPHVTPARGPWPMILVGLGVVITLVAFVLATAVLTAEPATKSAPVRAVGPSKPTPTAPIVPTIETSSPATPSATASATPTKPSTPAKPLTNEEFGKRIVASKRARLQGCVEQDLAYGTSVATAYSVTVLVERDGLPKNSATTFSPTPSRGFQRCASTVIFYAFSESPTASPKREEYTFSTSFAFPTAKPAAKKESGRGWD